MHRHTHVLISWRALKSFFGSLSFLNGSEYPDKKNRFLLKTEGAVQETGGTESKLSTQQCLLSLLPSSPHFSHPTSCLTLVSPPPLCSGWLSEGPPSPLNSYSSTLQRSNFELLPAMKYLPHRRDIFSQCWSRAWYKGATWKIERIWKEERSSLKLKSSNRKGTWLLC